MWLLLVSFRLQLRGTALCAGRGCGWVPDWRRREGLSGNLLLDSPHFSSPPRHRLVRLTQTNRQTRRKSLSLGSGDSSSSTTTTTGRTNSHCRRRGSDRQPGERNVQGRWGTPSATVWRERTWVDLWQRLGSSRAQGFAGPARGSTSVSSASP